MRKIKEKEDIDIEPEKGEGSAVAMVEDTLGTACGQGT